MCITKEWVKKLTLPLGCLSVWAIFSCSSQISPKEDVPVAFVTVTDFESLGGFTTIRLDDLTVAEEASPERLLSWDSTPTVCEDDVCVVNRLGGDDIQRMNAQAEFATDWRCSTGNDSDPQDYILLDNAKAYIPRLNNENLLVVNPRPSRDCRDFIVGEISLAQFAPASGLPSPTQGLLYGDLLYVSLQRMSGLRPQAPGMIAVIDTLHDRVVGSFNLVRKNPFGAMALLDDSLLVAVAGELGQQDGGIEKIALPSNTSAGFVLTEKEAGGDIVAFAIQSRELGYASVHAGSTGKLISFNPQTGASGATLLHEVNVSDLAISPFGQLFAPNRPPLSPFSETSGPSTAEGVFVFDARTGAQLTEEPIFVGPKPPFELVFTRALL